jgi:hypothetical protein
MCVSLVMANQGRPATRTLEKMRVSNGTLPVYSLREKDLHLQCVLGAGNMDSKEQCITASSSVEAVFPLLQAYITIRLALEKREDG